MNLSGSPSAAAGVGGPATVGPYIPTELILPDYIGAIFVPLMVSTLMVGLLANSLAVFITVRCSSERRAGGGAGGGGRLSVPAVYVRALLATDTCATVFFLVRGSCARLYSGAPHRCDLDMASNLFFSWTSGLVNLLMTCDRCFALGAPFTYHVHATRGRAYAALLMAVILSLLLSLLPLLGFGTYGVVVRGRLYCLAPGDLQVGDTSLNYSFNVLFFAVGLGILVVMYAANTVVLRQIVRLRRSLVVVVAASPSECEPPPSRRHRRRRPSDGEAEREESSQGPGPPATVPVPTTAGGRPRTEPARPQGQQSRSDSGRKEMHFGAIIIIFSLVFTLSWLPFYTQRLTMAIHGNLSHWSVTIVVYLLVLNHVIDPFVYVLMKTQYRRKLVQIGRSLCCRRAKAGLGRVGDGPRADDTRGCPSLGTASSTLTTSLRVESWPRSSGEPDGAPTIQVTAASPSLGSLASSQEQGGMSMIVIDCG